MTLFSRFTAASIPRSTAAILCLALPLGMIVLATEGCTYDPHSGAPRVSGSKPGSSNAESPDDQVRSDSDSQSAPSSPHGIDVEPENAESTDYSTLTEKQWRKRLTDEEFRILREKGTERAFTGKYWNTKEDGIYECAGCGQALYSSATKFDSGTGWPSFWDPVSKDAIKTESDVTFGMIRTELLCSRCDGHLGHVFEDGPAPTGDRHCINSASLRLRAASSGK